MGKIKVKKKKVILFNAVAGKLLSAEKGKFSPFLYALNKLKNQTDSIVEDYNDAVEGAKLQFAGKDEDGYALVDEKTNSYKLTPDNTLKLNKKVKAIGIEEVEITPHIVKEIPKDLRLNLVEILVPFVFDEIKEC